MNLVIERARRAVAEEDVEKLDANKINQVVEDAVGCALDWVAGHDACSKKLSKILLSTEVQAEVVGHVKGCMT